MLMKLDYSRHGYMGRCRDSCTIFGYVLRKRFERIRGTQPAILGLSQFEADKAIRLLDKVAEVRARELLTPFSDQHIPNEFQTRILTFPVDRNFNDKHGQRLAFPPAGDTPDGPTRILRPVLDVISAFDARSVPAERIFVVHEAEEAWGRIKYLEPQVSAASLVPLMRTRKLEQADISFLTAFGESCGVLSEREIESIGRHETATGTQESLLTEFERWSANTKRAFEALKEFNFASGEDVDGVARRVWQSWSFALECRKKSGLRLSDNYGSDRDEYRSAQEKYSDELVRLSRAEDENTGECARLRNYLSAAQPPGDKIWGDPLVSVLEFPSFCIWNLSTYFCGSIKNIRAFRETKLSKRLSNVQADDIQNAYKNVLRFVDIPGTSAPTSFSPAWWNQMQVASVGGFELPVSPSDLWDGKKTVGEFIDGAERVFDWVYREHVDPGKWGLRVQLAGES